MLEGVEGRARARGDDATEKSEDDEEGEKEEAVHEERVLSSRRRVAPSLHFATRRLPRGLRFILPAAPPAYQLSIQHLLRRDGQRRANSAVSSKFLFKRHELS